MSERRSAGRDGRGRGLRVVLLLVAIGTSLAASPPAHAEDDAVAARAHYQKGLKLYDLLRYRLAAHEFEQAYEAKPDPAFLYNIGQAYRLAGDTEQAIGAYRSFLRRMPKAPNRAEVEARIADLQSAVQAERRAREADPSGTLHPSAAKEPPVDEQRPAPAAKVTEPPIVVAPAPVATPPESTRTEPSRRRGFVLELAGGVVAGVGLAALSTGIVFGVRASSAHDQLSNPTAGQVFDPSVEDSFKLDRALSIALIAAGGVATIGGAVMFVLGHRMVRRPVVSLLPLVGRERAGASLRFEF